MRSMRTEKVTSLLVAMLLHLMCMSSAQAGDATRGDTTFRMTLEAPIATWDEAIPLGNGMLGGLLWGGGNTIHLSHLLSGTQTR